MSELVLAVEILSPSSLRVDRERKRRLYMAGGVREYWIVDLEARSVEYPIGEALSSFQKGVVRRLLSSSTLSRVANNEYKLGGDSSKAFTLPYFFTALDEALWSELTAKTSVGYQRRQIQRQHIESLVSLAGGSATDDSRMLAVAHLRKLKERLKLAQSSASLDEYTRLHFADLSEKIVRVLDAKMTVGGSGGSLPFLFGRPGNN